MSCNAHLEVISAGHFPPTIPSVSHYGCKITKNKWYMQIKLQKNAKFLRKICVCQKKVVFRHAPSLRQRYILHTLRAGSLRIYVRVQQHICQLSIFLPSAPFVASDYREPRVSVYQHILLQKRSFADGERKSTSGGHRVFWGVYALSMEKCLGLALWTEGAAGSVAPTIERS